MPVPGLEALARLREGNQRFVAGVQGHDERPIHRRSGGLPTEQWPIAVVLGCSDARVPAEVVFDQGLGDLFVIRVAGNIVAPSQVGSVEFAVGRFDTRLVVVLGHTQCGAVRAALDESGPTASHSASLRSIVDRIRPSIETLLAIGMKEDDAGIWAQAVRANVRASADHLRHGSALLEQLIHDGTLLVVGAEYSLETGEVEFFDGVPRQR